MVEEQAGIQVVGQVDQQLDATLADFEKLTLGGLALVLASAALTLATFDHHLLAHNAQRLRNSRQGIEQASLGLVRIDGAWRSIFLHMHPIAIQIDRQCVLRHIGVVQSITLDAFATRPFAELPQVLLQAVGEHLPTFAQTCLLHRSLLRLWLGGASALTGNELVQLDLDQ